MCANLSRGSPGPWPSGHRSGPVPRPPPDTPVAGRHCAAPGFDQRGPGNRVEPGSGCARKADPADGGSGHAAATQTARIHYPRWSTSPFLDSSPFMGRYSGPGLPPRPFGKVTPWWTFVERSSPLVDPEPNLSNCAPWPAPPAGGASDPPGRTGQHGDRCGSHQPGRETRPAADTRRAANCRLDGAGRDNAVNVPCHHCCPPHGRL
jgi:hypothetical protein